MSLPSQLVWYIQPAEYNIANGTIDPNPVLQLLDQGTAHYAPDPGLQVSLFLAFNSQEDYDGGVGEATLTGTTTVTTDTTYGRATFSNVQVSAAGTYTLIAVGFGMNSNASIVSAPFYVAPANAQAASTGASTGTNTTTAATTTPSLRAHAQKGGATAKSS